MSCLSLATVEGITMLTKMFTTILSMHLKANITCRIASKNFANVLYNSTSCGFILKSSS